MITIAIINLVFLGVFLVLSQPEEIRGGRWGKITLSMPLVFLISLAASSGSIVDRCLAFTFGILALSILWASNLSYFTSNAVVHLIFGGHHSSAGFRPDFRAAHGALKEGELDEAVRLLHKELEKDPKNYEGLMLLSQAYEDMRQPAEALKPLDLILNNPEATDAQKQFAQEQKAHCEQLKKYLDAARYSSPRR